LYTSKLKELRELIGPRPQLIAGDYILYGLPHYEAPNGIRSILKQTVTLYDDGELEAAYLFAGPWLVAEHMPEAAWANLDLLGLLEEIYYPFLGTATGQVLACGGDDDSFTPVAGAIVTVEWRGNLVARKQSNASGHIQFGGWVGRQTRVAHVVTVHTSSVETSPPTVVKVQLLPQADVEFKACLTATRAKTDDESGPFPPNTQASRFMRNPVLAYTPYAYNGGNWSAELFEPMLVYQSEDRSNVDELFDSVWLVGYAINSKTMFPKRDRWMNNSHSLNQADWVDFLVAQIAAARSLEAAAKAVSATLGRTVSPTVVVTLPYPDPRQDQFGHGSTDRMLNFSKTADRIAGAEWYVDFATQRWNATVVAEGWIHLRFVGFYWVEESVCGCVNHAQTGCTMCDIEGHPEFDKFDIDDAAILPSITAHVHAAPGNLLINWIPYYDLYNSHWAPKWRELGFDLGVLQPHVAYAGSDPSKVYGTNDTTKQFDIIADMVSSAGLGVEMEVASYTRNNLPEPDEDSWIYNFQLYCQAARNHSWKTDALKVWFHA
jgi:hypothetical protein